MPAILRCDPSRFDQPACGSILRNPLRPEEIPSPPTTLQSLGASLKRAFIPPSTSPYTRPTAQQAIDERKKREQAEAKKRNASPSSPPRAEVPLEAPKDDGPLLAPTLPKSPSIKFAPLPPSPQRTRRANSITIGVASRAQLLAGGIPTSPKPPCTAPSASTGRPADPTTPPSSPTAPSTPCRASPQSGIPMAASRPASTNEVAAPKSPGKGRPRRQGKKERQRTKARAEGVALFAPRPEPCMPLAEEAADEWVEEGNSSDSHTSADEKTIAIPGHADSADTRWHHPPLYRTMSDQGPQRTETEEREHERAILGFAKDELVGHL